jgi:polyphenol oxidase
MFTHPKIFSQFPELITYVGTRDFSLRPKQFHADSVELQEKVNQIETQFWFKKAFFLAQCHSADVSEILSQNLQETLPIDACFTKLQDISLNLVTADCVPILIYDKSKKIVWVVHAGWRGSSEKILEKTLQALRKKYACDMKDIFLFIWPSICAKCYEVGAEFASYFPKSISYIWEKYFLDLKGENLRQALECCVMRAHIEISDECTFELPEKYFSYRREKWTERCVCGIGMRE